MRTQKIYLASSWRNPFQPELVKTIREWGFEVYDFRNPAPGDTGFAWRQTGDPDYKHGYLVEPAVIRRMLAHPIAEHGYSLDFGAMQWADTCVMALPCGRSASFELGWSLGAGKRCIVFMPEPCEPELMYRDCEMAITVAELQSSLTRGTRNDG